MPDTLSRIQFEGGGYMVVQGPPHVLWNGIQAKASNGPIGGDVAYEVTTPAELPGIVNAKYVVAVWELP